MADSNRTTISYIRETAFGTTPSTGNLKAITPVGGGTFGQQTDTVRSQRIRSDAQVAGSKRTGVTPAATIPSELSPSMFDEFLRGAIRSESDWSTALSVPATSTLTVAASTTDKTATLTATASDTFANAVVGQWIHITAPGTGSNTDVTGWYKIKTKTSALIIVIEDPDGEWTADATAAGFVIKSSYLRNGNEMVSYTLQKQYEDLTDKYELIRGARPSSFSMDVSLGAIVGCEFGFVGKEFVQATATARTVDAADDDDVFAEVDNFDGIWIDYSAVDWDPTGLSLAGAAEAAPISKLGGKGENTGVRHGSLEVSGSLSAITDNDSTDLLGKYLDFDKFNLAFAFSNGDGDKRYLIELPQAVLTNEAGNVPGLNADKLFEFDFAAEPDEDLSKTIQICRVA